MADHSKPTLSSTYPNFVAEVKGRLEDASRQFDPANSESSNLVTGTIRWTSAAKKWEIWNGTSWGNLATEYAISISGSAAKLKTARSIALTGGATAAAVNFDGSANITLNVTALNPAQLSAAVPVNKGGTGASDAVQARANLGLGTAATTSASDYAAKSHTHSWSQVTGVPATATRWPTWAEVSDKPTAFAPSSHTHAWAQVTGAPATATRWPTWNEVSSKPAIPPAQQSLGYTAVGQLAMVITRYPDTNDRALAAGATVSGSNLQRPHMSVGQVENTYRMVRIANIGGGLLSGTWRVLNDGHRLGAGTIDTNTPGLYLAIRIS